MSAYISPDFTEIVRKPEYRLRSALLFFWDSSGTVSRFPIQLSLRNCGCGFRRNAKEAHEPS